MHDRHHSGSDPATGDTVTDEFPGEPMVDDALREAFQEPRRYLPPPGLRLHPESQPDEPETKLARRAKLAALILVVALLVASVVVAASLAQQEQRPGDETGGAAELTGASALGGLAMPGAGTGPFRNVRNVSAPTGDSTTGQFRHAAATTGTGKLGTVREFYSRVEDDPQRALALVAPALTSGHGADLVRAWRSIDSVTIEDLGEQDDGTVRAVVTMVPRHSGPVRVVQEFGVGDDVDGSDRALITEAKLLSVQPG